MADTIQPIRRNARPVYKLTDASMKTHGGYQWELGRTQTVSGKGPLCSAGWLHVYSHPDLAVILNPIHANFSYPRLFRAEASGVYLSDRSLKAGVSSLTLIEELPLPIFSHLDLVAWLIFQLRALPKRPIIATWEQWADRTLADRTLVFDALWLRAKKDAYARAYSNAFARAYSNACAYACAYADACAYACAHADACAYAYAYAHADACAYACAYADACAYAYAYAHADACALSLIIPHEQFLAWRDK